MGIMRNKTGIRLTLLVLLATLSTASPAQDNVKSGLDIVPYPVIGFSDELGVQYGVNCSLFDYGDGSLYPNYKQKAVVELARYTRGQTSIKATYNSSYLIPGIRFSAALAYNRNPMYHFYGFNGSANPIDHSIDHKRGVAYYNIDRRFIRATSTFQGYLTESLIWAGGLNFLSYKIGSIDPKYGFEVGRTLYDHYVETGVIRPDEANGGSVLEFCGGLVYDTRDAISVPTQGIWSELYLTGAPDLFNTGYSYLRLSAHFRQYLALAEDDRLTFAYHLAYQGLIAGEAPFYVLQNITSLMITKTVYEGLGNKNTIRGTVYNRFIGNAYAWANMELRIKLFSFNCFGQDMYIATNPFFDCGAIVSPFRLGAERGSELYKQATKLHGSLGLGLKLVRNRNFVISAEFAKPLNRDDGHFGLIMGSNYLF